MYVSEPVDSHLELNWRTVGLLLTATADDTTSLSSIRRHKTVCSVSRPLLLQRNQQCSPCILLLMETTVPLLFPPPSHSGHSTSAPPPPPREGSNSAFSFRLHRFASSFPLPPQNKEGPVGRRGWNKCKWRCREND